MGRCGIPSSQSHEIAALALRAVSALRPPRSLRAAPARKFRRGQPRGCAATAPGTRRSSPSCCRKSSAGCPRIWTNPASSGSPKHCSPLWTIPTFNPASSEPVPASRLDRSVLYEKLFKKVAVRLDERDLQRLLVHPFAVGSLQRPLLDALPGSQKRSFRNTWDYLDWTQSNGN